MTSAYYLGMVNSVLTGVIPAVMEFAIFAVVSAITYLRDKPFCDDLNNAPDIFPIVSILAAFCEGESVISGAGRLVGKESNRAEAILEMLSGLGVSARIEGDDLHVAGETLTSRLLNGRMLKGGSFTSHGDHRMAMALKIASIGADGPLAIDDTACVAKSFPGFWEMFD